MSVLDTANYIAQYDPQDFIGFLSRQPEQLSHDFGRAAHQFGKAIMNIVYAGMGDCSVAAELAPIWPQVSLPFVIARTYTLPAFVNEHTLVICASYSGNTEETIAALREAESKKAQIVVLTAGGALSEIAKAADYPVVILPAYPQLRAATFFTFRALLEILIAAGLVESEKLRELVDLQPRLEVRVKQWASNVPTSDNLAKQIAERLVGKTAIIYGGTLTYPAAYKWKIDINESAKNTAWASALPESNHNEFIGWTGHPVEKPFAVIDLLSSFGHPSVLKRFAVTDRLLSGRRPKSIPIEARGNSPLEHLLYLMLLGDFTAAYLGILNGINPSSLDAVAKFKKELIQ